MSIDAQLTPPQASVNQSTGPKTAAGKKRSSLNAYRHGLTGQICIFAAEDGEAYTRHCQGIRDALHPQGELEMVLAQTIADDRWRLARAKALENSIFALSLEDEGGFASNHNEVDVALSQACTWLAEGRSFQLLTLYEQRIQRQLEKTHQQLRAVQADRHAAQQKAVEKAVLLSSLAESRGQTYDAAAEFSSAAGFVCSSSEFRAEVDRERRLQEARKLTEHRARAAG